MTLLFALHAIASLLCGASLITLCHIVTDGIKEHFAATAAEAKKKPATAAGEKCCFLKHRRTTMDWFSDPERYGEEIANGWKAWQLAEVANAARIQFESAEAMWQAHPHYKPVPKWS